MNYLIYFLVPLIAFLYASVGFGGATGYLAVMSLMGIPPNVMASTALVLNIMVASIAFWSFYRAGHLRTNLALAFLVTSVPAAFIGGFFRVTDELYMLLLYSTLSIVVIRLLLFSKPGDDQKPLRPIILPVALGVGLGLGLLSGVVGIGGGILLSPIIIFSRWGTPKQAAAVSAAFIVLNSISGVLGRVLGGSFVLDSFGLSLIPLGLIGALAGSYLGVHFLNNLAMRRALGTVLLLVVANFWWTFFK